MTQRPIAALVLVVALSSVASASGPTPAPDLARLMAMTARFVPVEIKAEIAGLPDNEKQALAKLVEAARLVDALFLRQVSAQNEAWLLELVRDETPLGRARLHYFRINKGPWSRIDHDAPFLPGVGDKDLQANFYPAGATRDEVEAWLNALPAGEKAAATGFFTTIRRSPEGALTAVPYSLEYQGELARLSALVSEAAALTKQPTLKAFLEKRARAFVTNDYYDSDLAWMELDASIEPTIGPYEVYEDGWFNYKAAFEAFITVRDDVETAKLVKFGAELQELEDHLPIDPKYRRPKLGGFSPIRVVNVVISAGDGNRGVQTIAFNLPNDERVVNEKGSKRIMLKNTNELKFRQVLVPISKLALRPGDQPHVSFDAFFTHTLMHELMHGLGPQTINVAGRETTVRQELKEVSGPLEEAKADISGLWALQYLVDKHVIDKAIGDSMYVTFLTSAFRSIRFGVKEAHGRGIALQLNYLLDQGGFKANADGTFAIDPVKIKAGVAALAGEIMTLQATGDYTKAKAWLERMAVVRPPVEKLLDRLSGVPVDIEPRFPTAEALTAR